MPQPISKVPITDVMRAALEFLSRESIADLHEFSIATRRGLMRRGLVRITNWQSFPVRKPRYVLSKKGREALS